MKRHRPLIPDALLHRTFDLPVAEAEAHTTVAETLAPHRMLGWTDQQPGRTVRFLKDTHERPRAQTHWGEQIRYVDASTRVLAAASYLEGQRLEQFFQTYPKAFRGLANDEMHARLGMWHGVGVVPISPDFAEFGLVKKDHLYPHPAYCERLGMIGGGLDLQEAFLWSKLGEAATVAMYRELYEELAYPEDADELCASLAYAGSYRTTCYLWDREGGTFDRYLHVFFSVAESTQQWEKWRRIFITEEHRLAEARPALLTRSQLKEVFAQERQARDERQAYLDRVTRQEMLAQANSVDLKRFVHNRATQSSEQWKSIREEAVRQHLFPTKDRGDFAFIAGHGSVLETAMKANYFL